MEGGQNHPGNEGQVTKRMTRIDGASEPGASRPGPDEGLVGYLNEPGASSVPDRLDLGLPVAS